MDYSDFEADIRDRFPFLCSSNLWDSQRISKSSYDLSTSTDNITSVSRQNHNYNRRRRKVHRRLPSRTSSLSSMTENSMALEVITVTLNMETVGFLGISIVGQLCSRGDNGIYVANVMPGGAVALDGRIEPGDMILQVNDVSFEKFTNDQAVEALKEAVGRRGAIKLTVAKSLESDRSNYFTLPLREPVRPIDTQAWIQHTNAVRGMSGVALGTMNSIPEGSEGAPTPVPGQFPSSAQMNNHNHMNNFKYPTARASSSNNSNGSCSGSGAQQTVVGQNEMFLMPPSRLNLQTDPKKVVYGMALSNSGLEIRDHTWLKIPIPMSFLGSNLVDWLIDRVEGLRDRKDARRYASELLKQGLIAHVVKKSSFTEQCYYVFGDACEEFVQLRNPSTSEQQGGNNPRVPANNLLHYSNEPLLTNGNRFPLQQAFRSSVSGDYASMPPISPYPPSMINSGNNRPPPHLYLPYGSGRLGSIGFGPTPVPDMNSQASNNSNEESSGSDQRRKAILPPAPSLQSVMPNDPKFMGTTQPRSFQPVDCYPTKMKPPILAFPHQTQRPNTVGDSKAQTPNASSLRFKFNSDNCSEFFIDHL